MAEAEFRRCSVTGLQVHLVAQRLIVLNFLMAIISIIIGGIAAIFVGLTRSSFVLLETLGMQDTYYYWLNLHGFNILIFWILWFEVALIYFVSTVLLNAPLFSMRLGWLAFILMLGGWLIMNIMNFTGNSTVLFTAYIPMVAPSIFYLGYILFALGVGLAVILFFLTLYKARIEGRYSGHLPLVTWGAAIAAIIGENAKWVTINNFLILAITTTFAFGGTLILLSKLENDLLKRSNERKVISGGLTPYATALIIAIGLGVHNIGEGFAIASALLTGEIASAITFTVGFAVHNATEGFAIATPLIILKKERIMKFIIIASLIAGLPAVLGSSIYYIGYISDVYIANLNSIATASIVYATWHINLSSISKLRGIYNPVFWLSLLLGLVIAFITESIVLFSFS
jgi:zinc transporter ZupT